VALVMTTPLVAKVMTSYMAAAAMIFEAYLA
jgi:hypothetical protein